MTGLDRSAVLVDARVGQAARIVGLSHIIWSFQSQSPVGVVVTRECHHWHSCSLKYSKLSKCSKYSKYSKYSRHPGCAQHLSVVRKSCCDGLEEYHRPRTLHTGSGLLQPNTPDRQL
jgi:hypothetical protein